MAGKSGQIYLLKLIGTDNSQGRYTNQLSTREENNDVKESELDELYLTLNIAIGARKEPIQTGGHDENNSLSSRTIPNFKRSQLTNDECLNMIQAVYDGMMHEVKLRKSFHKSGSSEVVDKSIETNQRGQSY